LRPAKPITHWTDSAGAERPVVLWREGALVPWDQATIHVNAVGHASVSGVFEGIRAYWNEKQGMLHVFRLHEHMQRFVESARLARLKISFSVDQLVQASLALLQANSARSDMYIRPWCFARGFIREVLVPPDAPAEVVIDTWQAPSLLLANRTCTACISSWTRVDMDSMPVHAKAFANYHNGRLALAEARDRGCDWPILLNRHGNVTEGPGACVIAIKKGKAYTPACEDGILDSITRRTVLSLLEHDLHIPVVEKQLDRSELVLADELMFIGTGWEILRIAKIDGMVVGKAGRAEIVAATERLYHDVARGCVDRGAEWRTSLTVGESATPTDCPRTHCNRS